MDQSRDKKIAICFSGHFRNFANIKDNILENLVNPLKNTYDTDVFVHTWDTLDTENGPKGLEGTVNKQLVYTRTDINYILDILNPLRISILNKKECLKYLTLEHINPKHKINFDVINAKYTVINGELIPYSQLLGIYLANSLKSDVEQIHNWYYDIVIRVRPDFIFTKNIMDLINFQDKTIFLPNIWRYSNGIEYAINDTFAFGSSYSMDIYSSTICSYIQCVLNDTFNYECNEGNCLQYGVEQSLFRQLTRNFDLKIVELGYINKKA